MKTIKRFFLLVIVTGLVYACANISSPTGGPKDTVNPKFLASEPYNGATNVESKKLRVTLYFDELIQEEKLKQELIITPFNSDRKYKSKVKRNKLIIEFTDSLEQNTTYFMDFRNSIVDVTEKNPASKVFLTFSTGPYLDSLEILGTVRDLLTGEPIPNAVIGLYDATVDSVDVGSDPPIYFSKTNEKGLFLLERFKPGYYKIYAFSDDNGDYKYTQRSEKIAFNADPVLLDSSRVGVNLNLIDYDNVDLRFNTVTKSQKNLVVKFNKTVVDYRLTVDQTSTFSDSIFSKFDNEGNILLLYTGERNMEDSIQIQGYAIDSIDQRVDFDTMVIFPTKEEVQQEEKKSNKKGGALGGAISNLGKSVGIKEEETYKRVPLSFKQIFPVDNKVAPGDSVQLILEFERPVAQIEKDSILFIQGIDTTNFNPEISLNHNLTQATFSTVIADSTSTSILLKDNAFISVLKDSTNQKSISFSHKIEEDYGLMEVGVVGDAPNFFVQLVNAKNGEVVMEKKNEKDFYFRYIPEGSYQLRVLIDEDGDGVWSKGDFRKRINPERVVIHPKVLEVKANWEIVKEDATINIE